ncbi:MAG: hypothetical protein ACFB9N_08155 [Geitlerinemataceae cyanobacterium]
MSHEVGSHSNGGKEMAINNHAEETCELHASGRWKQGCCKNRKARIELYEFQVKMAFVRTMSPLLEKELQRQYQEQDLGSIASGVAIRQHLQLRAQ